MTFFVTAARDLRAASGDSPFLLENHHDRVFGTDSLDNVVVLHQRHLHRLLTTYFEHYHRWRCHQALDMDCPEPRPIQSPDQGRVVEVPEAGGLYRHYERWAA